MGFATGGVETSLFVLWSLVVLGLAAGASRRPSLSHPESGVSSRGVLNASRLAAAARLHCESQINRKEIPSLSSRGAAGRPLHPPPLGKPLLGRGLPRGALPGRS